jgi:5-(carboxyamino)imidazole ribonucleotide mutase
VLSAHRTPKETCDFAENARERGIKVVLCAAGGAAHLAGVVAAHTTLPVIGIPMDNPPLGGLDALLATAQMPAGVPVACVGVGGGGPVNAALLALRVIATEDEDLATKLEEFRGSQRERVLAKDADLQTRLT